jgi:hypothetical protein
MFRVAYESRPRVCVGRVSEPSGPDPGRPAGIENHAHNGKIGSVLIHYDPAQVSADDILYHLHKAGCLDSAISASPIAASSNGALVKQVGALFGNALFGTLLRKSVETSVLSLARGFR